MVDTTLTATIREGRGNGPARRVRHAGDVPAVVYGLGRDNEAVAVNAHDLDKILHSSSGVNSVITLKVGGSADQLVLTRQIDRHPVRSTLTHVDFIRVSADVDVAADVHLELTGEPEGVRLGGLLEQLLFSVGVACRPGDVPQVIVHDISGLGLGDQLHVSDLPAPAGVVFTNEPSDLIVQVAIPRGLAQAGAEDGTPVEGE